MKPPLSADELAELRSGNDFSGRMVDLWSRHLLSKWPTSDAVVAALGYRKAYWEGAPGYVFWSTVAERVQAAPVELCPPEAFGANAADAVGSGTSHRAAEGGSTPSRGLTPRWHDEGSRRPAAKPRDPKQGSLFE